MMVKVCIPRIEPEVQRWMRDLRIIHEGNARKALLREKR